MNEKLLYLHVNGDKYIEMYELLLKSLKEYLKEIDILVISTKEYFEKIKKINIDFNIENNSFIFITKYNSYLGSYSGKLDIIDWENINNYKKIIYTDTDILYFNNSLKILFDIIEEKDIVYITNENMHFTQPWFYHKNIYSEEETKLILSRNNNTLGINTGLFGWIHTPNCKVFEQIKNIRLNVNKKSKNIITDAAEQPYINHQFLLDNNVNNIFNKILSFYPESEISKVSNNIPIVFHYIGGNRFEKLNRMNKHIKMIN